MPKEGLAWINLRLVGLLSHRSILAHTSERMPTHQQFQVPNLTDGSRPSLKKIADSGRVWNKVRLLTTNQPMPN